MEPGQTEKSMTREGKCWNCEKMAALEEKEYNRITENYLNLEENRNNLVSREESIERMEICRTCSSLLNQITCSFCSCLVPVMVRLKNKHCPCPEGARW
jgi:hypothetical protein